MIKMLVSALLHTLANAIGLLIAATLLSGFSMNISGFVIATLIFTVVEVFAGPFIVKVSLKNLPALRGGVALVTTLVGLIVTTIFNKDFNIHGLTTWFAATAIVWLASVLAGVVLPMFLFKKILNPEEKKTIDEPPTDGEE